MNFPFGYHEVGLVKSPLIAFSQEKWILSRNLADIAFFVITLISISREGMRGVFSLSILCKGARLPISVGYTVRFCPSAA